MPDDYAAHEKLVESLNDETSLAAYKAPYDAYRPGFVPRMLGGFLIACGTLVYGRDPSYEKFRAIEVIARVPYHAWSSALFTLLTFFYANEKRAFRLGALPRFTTFAAENETMHVVVISALARKHGRAGLIRHLLIPVVFAFVYFWFSYALYLLNPRWSLEINYLFEQHAFKQYGLFLELHRDALQQRPMESAYLARYGRHPRSEYEFFRSVRNDELIHRNRSVHDIGLHRRSSR